MANELKRIENAVNVAVGKPLTWMLYLAWIACYWCFAQTSSIAARIRQQYGKDTTAEEPVAAR